MSNPDIGRYASTANDGHGPNPRGRKPIAEKYKTQIAAAERAFARDMAAEASRYVDELAPKEPERCPLHGIVLRCPAAGCDHLSERTVYNHRAAQYVFDRIMGKPSQRVEAEVTVRLVETLTVAFTQVFLEVNDLGSADRRQAAFAERCARLGALYGGSAA